jgi:hypothetical protein
VRYEDSKRNMKMHELRKKQVTNFTYNSRICSIVEKMQIAARKR